MISKNQLDMFKSAILETAEEILGRRRGSRLERWIQDWTWKIIDEREKIKVLRKQAKTVDRQIELTQRYREIDKAVKRNCR